MVQEGVLALAIDTCGPSGSAALGRIDANRVEVLGEAALEGRTYSATLIAAIQHLLVENELALQQVGCIVVVSGPGSFTGVRVGLSAAKGLAEGAGRSIAAVSRLQVLADAAGTGCAALDAHRNEVFLRLRDCELLSWTGRTGEARAAERTGSSLR